MTAVYKLQKYSLSGLRGLDFSRPSSDVLGCSTESLCIFLLLPVFVFQNYEYIFVFKGQVTFLGAAELSGTVK